VAATGRGVEFDRLDLRARSGVGWALFMTGRVGEAVAELRDVLELDPQHFFARRDLAIIDMSEGRYADATPAFEAVGEHGSLAHSLAVAGRADEARAELKLLEQQLHCEYISPVQNALAHLGLGDVDAALSFLER